MRSKVKRPESGRNLREHFLFNFIFTIVVTAQTSIKKILSLFEFSVHFNDVVFVQALEIWAAQPKCQKFSFLLCSNSHGRLTHAIIQLLSSNGTFYLNDDKEFSFYAAVKDQKSVLIRAAVRDGLLGTRPRDESTADDNL